MAAHSPITLPERVASYPYPQLVGISLVTNLCEPMTLSELDKPAELTVWPGHTPARVADACSFSTLRAALAAAAEAINTADAKPWIITEAGDILAPGWIRANTGSRPLQ